MNNLTKAGIIAAALAAGTLALWPADELPCDPGTIYMQTVAVRTEEGCSVETVALTCGDNGQPNDTLFTVDPESLQIPCDTLEWTSDVLPYPIDARYPACVVGDVERLETPDNPAWSPEEPTVCCEAGCRCKALGNCEHIAQGGPKFYELTRLHRLYPPPPPDPGGEP